MSDDLKNLEDKLKAAQKNNRTPEDIAAQDDEAPTSNRSMHAGTEFIAAVVGFGFLGYLIDRYFDTSPWGMLSLIMLGFVAGVYVASRAMNRDE